MRQVENLVSEDSFCVEESHILAFLDTEMHWQAAALARLARVPEGVMRETTKERIETFAKANGFDEITLEIAEDGLAMARKAMERMMSEEPKMDSNGKTNGKKQSICPFARMAQAKTDIAEKNQKD